MADNSYESLANTIGNVYWGLAKIAAGDSAALIDDSPYNVAGDASLANPFMSMPTAAITGLSGVSGLSFTCWVKPDNTSGNKCIIRIQATAANTLLIVRLDGSSVLLGGRSNSTEAFESVTVSSALTANTWTFIGLVLDYANDEIRYRVGATSSSSVVTFENSTLDTTTNHTFTIGVDEDLINERMTGAIYMPYLYDAALTADNLTSLYNSTSGYPVAANPPTAPDTTKVFTWNPDSNSTNISYTNSNLTANYDAVSGNVFYFAKFTQAYAKSFIYFEVSASDPSPDAISVIVGVTTTKTSQSWIGNGSDDVAINSGRALYVGGSSQGTDTNLPVFAYNTHRVCCAVDIAGEKVWIGYVNISTGVATYHGGGNPATDTTPSYTNSNWGTNGEEFIFPAVTPYGVGNALTIHYAESDFVGSVPSGFYALQYAAEVGGSMIVHPGMNGGING